MDKNKRFAVVKFGDESVKIAFASLKNGDTFELFNPDGTQVKDDEGFTMWIAESEVYVKDGLDDGVLTIDAVPCSAS